LRTGPKTGRPSRRAPIPRRSRRSMERGRFK
jgi:hypothetical protein